MAWEEEEEEGEEEGMCLGGGIWKDPVIRCGIFKDLTH